MSGVVRDLLGPMARAMAGRGNAAAKAAKADSEFYPTPPEVTVALLRAERVFFGARRTIWEPHCGEGGIASVLSRHGHSVHGSDIKVRSRCADGWHRYPGEVDFLAVEPSDPIAQVDGIVMNPPFSVAADHIRHALSFDVRFVACLLPANFMYAAGRLSLWAAHMPRAIYPCAWRPDFTGGGANMFNVQWMVWHVGSVALPFVQPLPRPDLTAELFE